MTSIPHVKEKKTTEIKSVTFGNQRQIFYSKYSILFHHIEVNYSKIIQKSKKTLHKLNFEIKFTIQETHVLLPQLNPLF